MMININLQVYAKRISPNSLCVNDKFSKKSQLSRKRFNNAHNIQQLNKLSSAQCYAHDKTGNKTSE